MHPTLMTPVLMACLAGAVAAQLPPVPVPAGNPPTEAKRILGKALFFEEQLSSDDTMACATCHLPAAGGADPRSALDPGDFPGPADDVFGSPGVVHADAANVFEPHALFGLDVQSTSRNAQTVIGVAFSPTLFWDGRATGGFTDPESGLVVLPANAALESQAVGPIVSDIEMGHADRGWDEVRAKLAAVRPLALATDLPPDLAATLVPGITYPQLFQAAFGSAQVTASGIAQALATYQRTLIPDQTPWDAFVAGNGAALTPAQVAGLQAFNATTCNACHVPPLFTGNGFRNIGLRPWPEDPGRFDITGILADRGRFKVPTLRNVGLRPRFMHTGTLGSLEQVVDFYVGAPGTQQFPFNQDPLVPAINVPPAQRANLVDFLRNALTDPRVRDESFPFDRPTLASERRDLELVELGLGHAGSGGLMPRWIHVAPAVAGSPDFKLGLRDTLAGTTALLGIGAAAARPGLQVLDAPVHLDPGALLVLLPVRTLTDSAGTGHATVKLPIPSLPGLIGLSLASQWFVADPGASSGLAATSGLSWFIH